MTAVLRLLDISLSLDWVFDIPLLMFGLIVLWQHCFVIAPPLQSIYRVQGKICIGNYSGIDVFAWVKGGPTVPIPTLAKEGEEVEVMVEFGGGDGAGEAVQLKEL